MKRSDIAKTYELNDNRFGNSYITSPGKFQGEPVWAPHFYEKSLDGCAEELSFMEDGCGEFAALVDVDLEDKKEWPELFDAECVLITENDQGFVSARFLKSEEEVDRVKRWYGVR